MSARNNVVAEAESKEYITVTEEKLPFSYEIIYPIIASGDVIGSVILLGRSDDRRFGATEEALVAFSANFFGKQMEQ